MVAGSEAAARELATAAVDEMTAGMEAPVATLTTDDRTFRAYSFLGTIVKFLGLLAAHGLQGYLVVLLFVSSKKL